MRRMLGTLAVGYSMLACGDANHSSLTSPQGALDGGGGLRGFLFQVAAMTSGMCRRCDFAYVPHGPIPRS